jgi:hypothetical protein
MPTNFLEYSGGTNGFLAVPATFMSTELNTLASGNSATQSVASNMTQSTWSSGIWGVAHFLSGGAFTPSASGYLAIWFLYSPDGGSTFEKVVSNTDQPRNPDITIPLFNSAYATNDISQSSGIFRLPWWTTKLFVVNHSGVSLPSSGNLIRIASVAIQY